MPELSLRLPAFASLPIHAHLLQELALDLPAHAVMAILVDEMVFELFLDLPTLMGLAL